MKIRLEFANVYSHYLCPKSVGLGSEKSRRYISYGVTCRGVFPNNLLNGFMHVVSLSLRFFATLLQTLWLLIIAKRYEANL